MITRKDFLTFISSFDLSSKKLHKLFDLLDQEDFDASVFERKDVKDVLGKDFDNILKNANMHYINEYKDKLLEKKIKLLSFEDEAFPEKLKHIDDPPYFLFCKGDVSLLKQKCVAIIGTRMPTTYGKIITEKFAGDLAKGGICVVSGLAYGVDSISHRKALEVGGKTIAVLGGGFDKIYPSEHTDLENKIALKELFSY